MHNAPMRHKGTKVKDGVSVSDSLTLNWGSVFECPIGSVILMSWRCRQEKRPSWGCVRRSDPALLWEVIQAPWPRKGLKPRLQAACELEKGGVRRVLWTHHFRVSQSHVSAALEEEYMASVVQKALCFASLVSNMLLFLGSNFYFPFPFFGPSTLSLGLDSPQLHNRFPFP